MTLRDMINPWGALRRAKDRTAVAAERLERAHRDWARAKDDVLSLQDYQAQLEQRLAAVTEAYDRAQRRSLQRQLEIQRLERLIANGHFRNPKTGRIGRRGETFE